MKRNQASLGAEPTGGELVVPLSLLSGYKIPGFRVGYRAPVHP
jgi:hypothetical protein